jgi:cephalosporin-C deacetylase-like acetyl esterase
LQKLTVSGHSFGGITATRAAFLDSKVKSCLTFDPWFFVHDKDVLNATMKLEQPFIMLNSEYFGFEQGYDCFKSIGTLAINSKHSARESLIIKNYYHHQQVDVGLHSLLELSLQGIKRIPINF